MQLPPLTRSLGSAERSLRALLEQVLRGADLGFAEWTALAFTGAGRSSANDVIQRQIAGRVVGGAVAGRASIDGLIRAGLLVEDQDDILVQTEAGRTVFARLSGEIDGITRDLYGDVPIEDLEATHRTLLEIAKRAGNLLGRAG